MVTVGSLAEIRAVAVCTLFSIRVRISIRILCQQEKSQHINCAGLQFLIWSNLAFARKEKQLAYSSVAFLVAAAGTTSCRAESSLARSSRILIAS